MRTVFIIIVCLLVCFAQEKPDSTKKKLKEIIAKQEKQTAFDSLLTKIAKEDSIKKAKK